MILYDVATRALSIDTAQATPRGAQVVARLDRHGQVVPLKGVSFGLVVTADGSEIANHEWPPAGVRYVKTDQDVLATYPVRWAPDQTIVLSAWLESPQGRVEASETFVAPRPTQPYPSWTWQGGQWVAPEPYPQDGQDYEWDEDGQSWEVIG